MEEDPSKTYPAADLQNLEEVIKQDRFMEKVYKSELGDDFESFENGVAVGEIRHPPLGPMSPFTGGPWHDEGEEEDV